MNAPVKYFGGKGGMIAQLLSYFPDESLYDTFVDAYGGSGVVLLNKPRVPIELYNDVNRNVYALFKVLRDEALFAEFYRLCQLALYDESTSNEYRVSLRGELDDVERAFRFWYVNRTRHNGIGGFSINTTVRRNTSKSVSDFLSSVDEMPELHARLSTVIVTNRDALELIGEFDRERTLIYLDPPYVLSTRTEARYENDVDDAHHERLVAALNAIKKAYVILSGYDNALYSALNGYTRRDFAVNTVSGTGTPKQKMESLWMNYDPIRTLPMFANLTINEEST